MSASIEIGEEEKEERRLKTEATGYKIQEDRRQESGDRI